MAYQVIARKWRPQRFDDVVGQQAVTRTLRNALKSGRLAQAFVFAGPRGVGKTTTARILARALNCELGPTADPCGTCEACVEIAEGHEAALKEIGEAFAVGDIDEATFKSELDDEAKTLQAELRAVAVLTKAIAQRAVNAFRDALFAGVKAALAVVI